MKEQEVELTYLVKIRSYGHREKIEKSVESELNAVLRLAFGEHYRIERQLWADGLKLPPDRRFEAHIKSFQDLPNPNGETT